MDGNNSSSGRVEVKYNDADFGTICGDKYDSIGTWNFWNGNMKVYGNGVTGMGMGIGLLEWKHVCMGMGLLEWECGSMDVEIGVWDLWGDHVGMDYECVNGNSSIGICGWNSSMGVWNSSMGNCEWN